MPVANLRVFRPPLSRGQSGSATLLSRQAGRTIAASEEKSLVVAGFIVEIEEEFQRQSSGKGIFPQVCAVAFLVFMQWFRIEAG